MNNWLSKKTLPFWQTGHALLTLVVFMAVAVLVTAAAIILIVVNTRTTTQYAVGERSYAVAETGAENALLRLLRNPSYTGEMLQVSDGTATITVTGADNKTIISVGRVQNSARTIRVQANFAGVTMVVTAWEEI